MNVKDGIYEALATEQAVPSHNAPTIPASAYPPLPTNHVSTLNFITTFSNDLRNSQIHIQNKIQLNQIPQAFNKWHGAR